MVSWAADRQVAELRRSGNSERRRRRSHSGRPRRTRDQAPEAQTKTSSEVEVDELRWSHDSVFDHFGDHRSVYETVVDLLQGRLRVEDIPPLQVVVIGELKYSLSNRRLYALRTFKRIRESFGVPAAVAVPVEIQPLAKGGAFTTQNQGTSVELVRPMLVKFPQPPRGPRSLSQQHRQTLSQSPSRAPSSARNSGPRVVDHLDASAPASSAAAPAPEGQNLITLDSIAEADGDEVQLPAAPTSAAARLARGGGAYIVPETAAGWLNAAASAKRGEGALPWSPAARPKSGQAALAATSDRWRALPGTCCALSNPGIYPRSGTASNAAHPLQSDVNNKTSRTWIVRSGGVLPASDSSSRSDRCRDASITVDDLGYELLDGGGYSSSTSEHGDSITVRDFGYEPPDHGGYSSSEKEEDEFITAEDFGYEPPDDGGCVSSESDYDDGCTAEDLGYVPPDDGGCSSSGTDYDDGCTAEDLGYAPPDDGGCSSSGTDYDDGITPEDLLGITYA